MREGMTLDPKLLMEILTHVSCALSFGSFLVRDMLWLRSLAIASSLVWVGAMLGTGHVIAASLFWNGISTAINIWQIAVIYHENRAVSFNDEEKGLYEALFRNFKPGEFVKILRLGDWRDLAPGEVLVQKGDVTAGLWVLNCGEAVVMDEAGLIKARLGANDLAGEMSFLTGEPPSASVTMSVAGRALFWPREKLEKFFKSHPTIKIGCHSVISTNLACKLKR